MTSSEEKLKERWKTSKAKLHTKKTGKVKRKKITAIGEGKCWARQSPSDLRQDLWLASSIFALWHATPLLYRNFDKLPNLAIMYPSEKILLGLQSWASGGCFGREWQYPPLPSSPFLPSQIWIPTFSHRNSQTPPIRQPQLRNDHPLSTRLILRY